MIDNRNPTAGLDPNAIQRQTAMIALADGLAEAALSNEVDSVLVISTSGTKITVGHAGIRTFEIIGMLKIAETMVTATFFGHPPGEAAPTSAPTKDC